jgi:2,5-diketo-D-gluconate reductase B
MQLEATFQALNQLVREGKVRHLGVSNFKLRLLKQSVALSETPLLTNQVPYSLFDRTYAQNGVLDYCRQHAILLTAYSPVKSRSLKTNPVLQAIARRRDATPQQIALAWLTTQPRVITIPMSFNPQHQAENLRAADLVLTPDEMEQLDRLTA